MSKELELQQKRNKIRSLRNRYYAIVYSNAYGAQVRNYAVQKIIELEEQMEQLKKQIEKERNKIWKQNF